MGACGPSRLNEHPLVCFVANKPWMMYHLLLLKFINFWTQLPTNSNFQKYFRWCFRFWVRSLLRLMNGLSHPFLLRMCWTLAFSCQAFCYFWTVGRRFVSPICRDKLAISSCKMWFSRRRSWLLLFQTCMIFTGASKKVEVLVNRASC